MERTLLLDDADDEHVCKPHRTHGSRPGSSFVHREPSSESLQGFLLFGAMPSSLPSTITSMHSSAHSSRAPSIDTMYEDPAFQAEPAAAVAAAAWTTTYLRINLATYGILLFYQVCYSTK